MNEKVFETSPTGGVKEVKLERPDLIPVEPWRIVATHFGIGAQKYSERNWEKGYLWSRSYASLQRHASQFWGGEDIDTDLPHPSPHLAGVIFHALVLLEFMRTHPEYDDRPHHNNKNQDPLFEIKE